MSSLLIGTAFQKSATRILFLGSGELCKEKRDYAVKEAIYHGAVLRLRPKLMTLFAILGGLIVTGKRTDF